METVLDERDDAKACAGGLRATVEPMERNQDRVRESRIHRLDASTDERVNAGGTKMATKRSAKIYTHLWYAKEAEEAARLYASIFPDSRVDGVWSLPSDSPSGPAGSVKVVDFTLLGQRFQAITAGPHHDFNDAISLVVLCDDQAELDRYWNSLVEGGGKPQACGWLIDRFGLRWQIVPAVMDEMMRESDAARSKRVTDAMLKMVKLDIAALEKAYRS
jgi:predicted 3-demethylubiquinone-9 3-methyltransferase (glyoxalase superfamily)